ncbi:GNAT family N-acetyltransferase [Shewanella sp. KX20019]|uniref:GNAT family N-acetyltransferase n=1 Tax=Shewanella sp. KX20019 TaxID=2803864 RepID=UPI001925A68B|nr:GNAT family N-acetyltransferase [Shewanella sp. KX20019]QQX78820.1 GNAT family N-acetyltransferase [Shewanella sp. KX20019]
MLELYSDRLRLRTLSPSDWDNFLYTHLSEELNKYVRKPQAEIVIREKFERALIPNDLAVDERLLVVVEEVQQHDFVGFVSLHHSDESVGRYEVGYMLHDNAQGRGFASEALKTLIDWLCIAHNPHKLIALCADENIASSRVLEKCGFIQEGLLRQNWKVGENWLDERLYGLLMAERA